MINPNACKLRSVLRCPECHHSTLDEDADHLRCPACAARYPINAHGVPLLLSGQGQQHQQAQLESDTGQAMVQEYQTIASDASSASELRPTVRPWWSFLRPPSVHYDPNADLSQPHTRILFSHAGPATLALSVGGGPTRHRPEEITLNIESFYNVDLVGDAHDLPLNDNSVDTVICNAVLEHVHDPYRVAAELKRVLKPGGYLYAEMPFMFFFHGYPNDYTRFTQEGMRRLFGEFDDMKIGISGGPMSALLQTANIVLQMFIPPSWRIVRKAFNGVFRWLFFPLKYCDRFLNQLPEAHTVAAGFYVMGRKPQQGPSQ